jgi:polysaccharide export outer membrane protein
MLVLKKYRKLPVLLIISLLISMPVVKAEEIRTAQKAPPGEEEEKKQAVSEEEILQIDSLYRAGKDAFAQENYFRAIVKFRKVLELEKSFYPVYTPYAKEYIQLAQDKIKQSEQKELQLRRQVQGSSGENRLEPAAEANKAETTEALDASGAKEQGKLARPETVKEETFPSRKIAEEKAPTLEYTINEADVLYISVWREPDLSQEVIVRPDGKISFPLTGEVSAAGLSFGQLKKELTRRLQRYLKYPVVSISLRKIGGRKVIVLGEVKRPGVYAVSGKKTLLEAIALAGGFNDDAVASSVILIRGGLRNPEGKRFNLSRAIKKTEGGQNVSLQPEDIVFVPKKFIANVNYYLTQILNPISRGAYTVDITQRIGE